MEIEMLLKHGVEASKNIDKEEDCELPYCDRKQSKSITFESPFTGILYNKYICTKCFESYIENREYTTIEHG